MRDAYKSPNKTSISNLVRRIPNNRVCRALKEAQAVRIAVSVRFVSHKRDLATIPARFSAPCDGSSCLMLSNPMAILIFLKLKTFTFFVFVFVVFVDLLNIMESTVGYTSDSSASQSSLSSWLSRESSIFARSLLVVPSGTRTTISLEYSIDTKEHPVIRN